MHRYCRSHLADETLLRSAATHAAHERAATADLLADLAEIDARRLFVPAGYPSLYAWCVGELRLSEQAAYRRILAARTARRFPVVFQALAEGRLHLTAVCLLAPHLTEDTAAELLAVATHQTKAELEGLLAERFPRPDVLGWVAAIPASSAPPAEALAPSAVKPRLSPAKVDTPGDATLMPQLSPAIVGMVAPLARPAAPPVSGARVVPLSAQSFGIQFTFGRAAHEKLLYAQALLGHSVPSGDPAQVFERALDALIPRLEQAKFGATKNPRPGRQRASTNPRLIPAEVRRAVWERDQGRCTFVSKTGRRCEARKPLEFDHVDPVARGGQATVARVRLRCRAHNSYEAERTFGAEFMRHKRRAAQEQRSTAKAKGRARAAARARDDAAKRAAEQAAARQAAEDKATAERARELDVVPWLQALGFRADEARRAAARCDDIPDAPLEARVRRALSCVSVRGTRTIHPGEGPMVPA